MFGWVQIVGTKTDTHSDRVLEIDPLEVFQGVELPFAFYGLTPALFDAPYRSDRSRYLDWVAHSFLCFAPTHPVAKEVEAVTGFSWGFTLKDGEVEVAPIRILQLHALGLACTSAGRPSWSPGVAARRLIGTLKPLCRGCRRRG